MNNKTLEKFILTYLIEKEEYLKLSTRQQQIVYETCKTISQHFFLQQKK